MYSARTSGTLPISPLLRRDPTATMLAPTLSSFRAPRIFSHAPLLSESLPSTQTSHSGSGTAGRPPFPGAPLAWARGGSAAAAAASSSSTDVTASRRTKESQSPCEPSVAEVSRRPCTVTRELGCSSIGPPQPPARLQPFIAVRGWQPRQRCVDPVSPAPNDEDATGGSGGNIRISYISSLDIDLRE